MAPSLLLRGAVIARRGSASASLRLATPWLRAASTSSAAGKGAKDDVAAALAEQTIKEVEEQRKPLAAVEGEESGATGEIGGPKGAEPTRYGDWERKGRVTDF